MRYTNRLGLPESIANAVINDPYTKGPAHISVTGLIGPARKRQLEIQHDDELVTDVADRIWALYGQVVHAILERADEHTADVITERRLFIERHGWTISGQFDRLILKAGGTLQDYKFTSFYTVKDGIKPEYEAQANLYRLMLEEHGYEVSSAEVVAVLRDWSKTKARHSRENFDDQYPQAPVVILPARLWSRDETETYIRDRLMAHGTAQRSLPECTDEERWANPPIWKVRKQGNKTASKGHANHQTRMSAETARQELQANAKKGVVFEIVDVRSTNKRCSDYCEAAAYCSQWRRLNPNKLGI